VAENVSDPAESWVSGTAESMGGNGMERFSQEANIAIAKLGEGDVTYLFQYATTHLLPSVLYAAVGLGIIFFGYLLASYLSQMISRPVCRRVDETLGRFAGKIVFYGVLLAVTGAVLSKMGAPLGGLAAMLAAAGFAIGLAFQGTLSNFASGVLLLVFRPFKVGDMVNAAGVMGKVNEIDLFTTTLDTPDNRRIIVPNSAIAGSTIENISYHPHRRIEVLVGVQYRADLQATREALQRAVDNLHPSTIQGEGRGSAVLLANLGDSAVQWKVRMWVATADFFPLTEALTGEIKQQLDAANIGIPYPQLDVHLSRLDGAEDELPRRTRIRPVRRGQESHESENYQSLV